MSLTYLFFVFCVGASTGSEALESGIEIGDLITGISFGNKKYMITKESGHVVVEWAQQPVRFAEVLLRAPVDKNSKIFVQKVKYPNSISGGSSVETESSTLEIRKTVEPYTGALYYVLNGTGHPRRSRFGFWRR